mmetsp:Transcript_12886/g.30173  ORF Transcript_12886/g.30173 Transcript_12886/m.30173 type:complete len:129 (-) Transcript_12886:8-394(-)
MQLHAHSSMWAAVAASLLLLVHSLALEAVTPHAADAESSTVEVPRVEVALQLAMSTRSARARSLAGVKLHHRRQRVHIWSKPCRKLPLPSRAACERKVDADVLRNDTSWVPLNPHAKPSALTLRLEHD